MVYRNNDIPPPKKQAHTWVAMIATAFFIVMLGVLFSIIFTDINIWWKVGVVLMSLYILYGIGSMIKKALIGKDYCVECGRPFDK